MTTKEQRRQELEAIRGAAGGVHTLAALYNLDLDLVTGKDLPDFMVDALIDHILRQELPDTTRAQAKGSQGCQEPFAGVKPRSASAARQI
jgi:hypothetical protein